VKERGREMKTVKRSKIKYMNEKNV